VLRQGEFGSRLFCAFDLGRGTAYQGVESRQMPWASVVAMFLVVATTPVLVAQSRGVPASDGSDSDIHLMNLTLRDLIS
jgi:hypothetical protein